MTPSFQDFHLSEESLKAVADLGYKEPTEIQAEAIGFLMQGYDLIGRSQTGTGKTAAFALPLIERIEPLDRSLQAVVLCPTRELCMQVAGEIRKLLKYHDSIRVLPVYGGQPIDKQIQALKGGVQIVVGTPGRFLDHMQRHTLKPRTVHTVVLDEADEMLDMGFREDIETILSAMPEERQSALFSATMPEPIIELARTFLKDPKTVRSSAEELTVPAIQEVYFDIKEKLKTEALCRILEFEDPRLCLVFCNTKKRADDLGVQLSQRGLSPLVLHGDLDQRERDLAMKKFRSRASSLMVATDIAARGLDIENIDLVVNYDVPDQEEFYVHRIGRTGRAGKEGKAYTFVVGREMEKLQRIVQYTGTAPVEGHLPTLADMESKRTQDFLQKIRQTIDEDPFEHTLDHSRRLVEQLNKDGYAPEEVAAVLIQQTLGISEGSEPFDLSSGLRLPEKDYRKEKQVTVYLNLGTRQRIRPKDILGAITARTGIQGYQLGEITIGETSSRIEVPQSLVRDLLETLPDTEIKGYLVSVSKEDFPVPEKDGSAGQKKGHISQHAHRAAAGKNAKKGVHRRS